MTAPPAGAGLPVAFIASFSEICVGSGVRRNECTGSATPTLRSRRRDCHSAAPPSSFSRRLMGRECQLASTMTISPRAAATSARKRVRISAAGAVGSRVVAPGGSASTSMRRRSGSSNAARTAGVAAGGMGYVSCERLVGRQTVHEISAAAGAVGRTRGRDGGVLLQGAHHPRLHRAHGRRCTPPSCGLGEPRAVLVRLMRRRGGGPVRVQGQRVEDQEE